MKFLKYGPIGMFSIFTALVACGSSDATGGGTPGSGAPCNLVAEVGCDAVVTCAKTHCSADVTTCFGSDFKGGACASYTACLNACTGCSDSNCRDNCGTALANDTTCLNCLNGSLQTCSNANNCTKAALCTTGTAGSGAGGGSGSGAGGGSGSGAGGTAGSGTGTSCAMLAACCPTLPANVQGGCQALAMQGNETNCAAIYSSTCVGGAGGASGAGAGGFSGSGTAGSGTAGSGTAGSSGAGAWDCQDNSGDCVCVQVPGGTPSDTCTTKPSCCIEALSGSTDTCICTDLTGTGVTCAQLAPAIMGTVVSTCPPP